MTTFPNSPRLLKGGIVVSEPNKPGVQRISSLQHNPSAVTRALPVRMLKGWRK
jgi:hypothetical protein